MKEYFPSVSFPNFYLTVQGIFISTFMKFLDPTQYFLKKYKVVEKVAKPYYLILFHGQLGSKHTVKGIFTVSV